MDEPDNTDRAGWVSDWVEEFAHAHYPGGEETSIMVQDFITNLGHYLDRHTPDDEELQPFWGVLMAAFSNYEAEFHEALTPPDPDDALSVDECEAANVDPSGRYISEWADATGYELAMGYDN